MFQRTILGSLFLLALATPAFAKKEKDIVNADPATFPALRVEIEKDMRGDKYSELSQPDRARVSEALERMETTLSKVEKISQLRGQEKLNVANDQALVNNLLTSAAADSREVCRRERRVGSHRMTAHCRTVAEWRRAREQTQDEWERNKGLGNQMPAE